MIGTPPLEAAEVLDRLLDDVGSGSLAELAKRMRLTQVSPTCAVLDFGSAGRFRVSVRPEPPEPPSFA